jgi:aspartate/methionine/tyrosine aminotransferase
MPFQPFELEHYQSQFERTVEYNLADSSVQCANMRELVNDLEAEQLLRLTLFYPEVNGTRLLRERIAALYHGAGPGNIIVTVGASQANSLICSTLLEPGDEVIVISPGYRQVWGLAKNLGCRVKEAVLRPEAQWKLDLDLLNALCTDSTKLVSVVNPNNPSGKVLTPDERRQIMRICAKHGAWLHADEVYCGTEFGQAETRSFWGEYDKTICVNSMSKAYGLAGLRIGWAVAAPDVIEALWRRHEYAVIAAGGPSMKLAEIALQHDKRQMLLDRQKKLASQGHMILQDWLQTQNGVFSMVKPDATAIAFLRYHFDVPSFEMAEHIRKTSSVLVAPGAFLGTEHHLRISVGHQQETIAKALDRIGAAAGELVASAR